MPCASSCPPVVTTGEGEATGTADLWPDPEVTASPVVVARRKVVGWGVVGVLALVLLWIAWREWR
jgi:hypothetical protein